MLDNLVSIPLNYYDRKPFPEQKKEMEKKRQLNWGERKKLGIK